MQKRFIAVVVFLALIMGCTIIRNTSWEEIKSMRREWVERCRKLKAMGVYQLGCPGPGPLGMSGPFYFLFSGTREARPTFWL